MNAWDWSAVRAMYYPRLGPQTSELEPGHFQVLRTWLEGVVFRGSPRQIVHALEFHHCDKVQIEGIGLLGQHNIDVKALSCAEASETEYNPLLVGLVQLIHG